MTVNGTALRPFVTGGYRNGSTPALGDLSEAVMLTTSKRLHLDEFTRPAIAPATNDCRSERHFFVSENQAWLYLRRAAFGLGQRLSQASPC